MAKKLLVVDDDEALVELYQTRLEIEGYDVKIARSAKEALEVVKDFSPDVVLLDIMLPEVSGYELFNILKSDASLKKAKYIFITALNLGEGERQKLSAQSSGCLCKPETKPIDLIHNIQHALAS